MCLDCIEVGELCDTCSFAYVRVKWMKVHGSEPPSWLWQNAHKWGGRHVLRQCRRNSWRHDLIVQRGPRSDRGAADA
jgi:hypothetical protein